MSAASRSLGTSGSSSPEPAVTVAAPPHPREAERLAALYDLDILDTAADRRFDRLTALAADVLEVPIALISLVDANRQWFKSACGLSLDETPRAPSFCGHAILEEQLLVIEDARLDRRFAKNPFVVGAPYIRFYAGVVLRSVNALPLGTLCVIDQTPRIFDRVARRRLVTLGELVEQELEHQHDLQAMRRRLEAAR